MIGKPQPEGGVGGERYAAAGDPRVQTETATEKEGAFGDWPHTNQEELGCVSWVRSNLWDNRGGGRAGEGKGKA